MHLNTFFWKWAHDKKGLRTQGRNAYGVNVKDKKQLELHDVIRIRTKPERRLAFCEIWGFSGHDYDQCCVDVSEKPTLHQYPRDDSAFFWDVGFSHTAERHKTGDPHLPGFFSFPS